MKKDKQNKEPRQGGAVPQELAAPQKKTPKKMAAPKAKAGEAEKKPGRKKESAAKKAAAEKPAAPLEKKESEQEIAAAEQAQALAEEQEAASEEEGAKTREAQSAGAESEPPIESSPELEPPPQKGPRSAKAIPVVGIGASAGGLEPLEAFFAHIPADKPDLAFVVIQHLSPQRKSIIGQILEKDTDMPILEIKHGMEITPNTVYFNPPDREVGIEDGKFQLIKPAEARHTRLPIDAFFRSLAKGLEEKAICIVLSGTGTDGTLGLEAVKGAGGMTIAQAEEQAKYPFMPRSAIDTGLVDFILPVEQMPGEIIRYVKHPYLEAPEQEVPADQRYQTYLQKVLMLVRAHTKHDFSHYKQTTIRRRVGRRMAVHKLQDIGDYFRYLQEQPDEIQTLFKDLVICVTSFFRDPEAFKALETRVAPEIVKNKANDQPIRIWVAGCGSGEEALSIAIIFEEAMERAGKNLNIQIFGTDIDQDAIDKARQGEYPESISADISPERLKKYFVKRDSTYKIKQEIREMVVYAVQNLISDPPFSRLDLISCRNVLIYLDGSLQKQILPLFHFTLNANGFLFLGASESIGGAAELFGPVDNKWKIYQRKGSVHHHLADYPHLAQLPALVVRGPGEQPPQPPETDANQLAASLILENYAPPSILVNSRYDVLYFQGDTGKFLGLPHGKATLNLMDLAREDIRPRLVTTLHQAQISNGVAECKPMPYRQPGGDTGYVQVIVHPMRKAKEDKLFLVVFQEQGPPAPQQKAKRKSQELSLPEASRVQELENELQATKEYLQTTVEELEASNEELKSTNEELQSTNEELQSTNEELETAKEELQSTNEELVTVNSELNSKIDELTEVNNDISNLLASTEIGTIFLGQDLKIKRFTPAATQLFNLIPGDVGRSIKDITPKTEYSSLWQDAEKVLHSLQVKELELQSFSGESYALRILPYRTRDNVIDGVVLTFIDISAEHLLGSAKTFAENIVDTVREPLLVLDDELRVAAANQTFYRTFQTSKEETEHLPIYELGDGQWDIPQLRELLEEIIPRNASFHDFQVEHDFPQIGKKTMILNARRLPAKGEHPHLILLAIEDTTEKLATEQEYREIIARQERQIKELQEKK
jgi:two-component system CheB/CheR fusion protein